VATWEEQVSGWLTLAELAEALHTDVLRAKQVISDREVLATRRVMESGERVLVVPADFISDGVVVKHLQGTISLLADSGFSDEEALTWLFTPWTDLEATPIALLRSDRNREVKRRAQASAW
jgi:hypothetical protein